MGRIEFTKLQCGGNDFVLIDLRRCSLPVSLSDLATQVCRRRVSVGADGLLVISTKDESDIYLLYFNADGSEARFCGNGLLCASQWVHTRAHQENPIRFDWNNRKYETWVAENGVRSELPPPQDLRLDMRLESGGEVSYVVVGVPHVVRFETELEQVDVGGLGRRIRCDSALSPEGANVDFCQRVDTGEIRLRTYERGVEGETLSCGSGAAAATYVAYHKGMVNTKVKVLSAGGEAIIDIDGDRIFLEGKPVVVYEGVLERS